MESNLQHEDLLMKIRAKLNEEKIKLWEPPYVVPDCELPPELEALAKRFTALLSVDEAEVVSALRELQILSIEHSKANAAYKETGVATLRIKATVAGEKPREFKVQKTLDSSGSNLISCVATEVGVTDSRVKLIFMGKVLKPEPSIGEQGIKNASQIMALIMAETPEDARKEDEMYMEMKATRDDAILLSECPDDLEDEEEYMKLEDQWGAAVRLPARERRALVVALALHARGRRAARANRPAAALVALLEADAQYRSCNSSILQSVDNWALLQLDIAWCYLRLRSLKAAADAAPRLQEAEKALLKSYGEKHKRVEALKGTAANERVVIMRLYLLQGIVAYHQNRRDEAKVLLDKAEVELNALRVDDSAVATLVELGWAARVARAGLRAAGGDPARAHHYLADSRDIRQRAREQNRLQRERRLHGVCVDGSPVNPQLVEALVNMGYSKKLATEALRTSNNNVGDAVRIIQEEPELLGDSDLSLEETESSGSGDSLPAADLALVAELEAMGYVSEEAKAALQLSRNDVTAAVELLVAGGGTVLHGAAAEAPSTSAGAGGTSTSKTDKKHKTDKGRKEREAAFRRLWDTIRLDDDDHLDSSLVEEEEYLAQYKSLL